jgi:hypothetical protein
MCFFSSKNKKQKQKQTTVYIKKEQLADTRGFVLILCKEDPPN